MDTLYSLFPDVDVLLKIAPEDLGSILLTLALSQEQQAGFIPAAVTQISTTDAIAGKGTPKADRLY